MMRHPSKRSCHRSYDGLRTCAASVGAGWSIGAKAASTLTDYGAYRIIYLATIADAVHALHAFQKKTQATAKRDIDLAMARLRQIR
jgi:phage-related protein